MEKEIQWIDEIAEHSPDAFDKIDQILACQEEGVISYLFQKADAVCQQSFDNKVFIRAIIEFSNYCRCECAYCGLFRGNKKVPRYRMSEEEILSTCLLYTSRCV